MLIGLMCALGAGLMWGLVFIVPLVLPDYSGLLLSFGRYSAYGLVALIPAWLDRARIAALTKADWLAAFKLSLAGNLIYYAALASAVQLADAPLPAMLIGTLPVVISICANWMPGHPSEKISWMRLAPSLLLLLLGVLLVNAHEFAHLDGKRTLTDYATGCALTLLAIAAWTWYPIKNAHYLSTHPKMPAATWATVQGLALLPLSISGFFAAGWYAAHMNPAYHFPLGPQPGLFLGLMLVSGVCASWLGSVLWNKASQRLPTSLAGQLIVFESLAALFYAFLWREALPSIQVLAGAVLLCIGVLLGARAFRKV